MSAVNTSLLCQIANAEDTPPVVPTFPAGATHYWALEEAAGNARVDSVGGLSMVEQGGTIPNAVGKHGNALDLRATARFLQSASFTLVDGFSIVAWVNLDNLPATESIIFNKVIDAGFSLSLINTGQVKFFSSDDGDAAFVALGALDSWHLIVAVSDGAGTNRLSVDGSIFTDAIYFGVFDNTSVGTFGALTTSVDGLVDEVAIFGRALTQQEVADIWNGGVGTFGP